MSFLELKARDENKSVKLRVVRDTLEVIPDVHINITDLNRNGNLRNKQFFNNGYGGITFKCQAMFNKKSKMNGVYYKDNPSIRYPTSELVDDWYRLCTPLIVSTDAMDLVDHDFSGNIINGLYIITKISSKKQTSDNWSKWDMEFTSYTPLNLVEYKNDNSAVKKALKKAKKTNNLKALENKFKECGPYSCKFSKKKKTVSCVKILQQLLQKNHCYIGKKIDGWYGPDTRGAVGGFQFQNKLKVTGKVDAKTFKHMCKG